MYKKQNGLMNLESNRINVLAKKISQSDRQAFDDLFRLMYPGLVRYAVLYLKDKQIACDVAQDTFIKLWKQRTNIDPNKSLKSLLYRMVKNRCLNLLRDHEKLIVNSDLLKNESSEPHPEEYGEYQADGNGLSNLLREWIDSLPERQKEAFKLSRFEGLNHQEIADIMEISAKTVNNHIVAALHQLRAFYEDHQNNQ